MLQTTKQPLLKQPLPTKLVTPCHNLKKDMSICYESENMFHIGIDHINIIPTHDHSAVHSYKLENSKQHFKNSLNYYFSNEKNVEIFSQDCNSTQNTELDYTYSLPVRCTEFSEMTNIDFRTNCILSGTEPRLNDMMDFSCKNIKLAYNLSEINYRKGINSGMIFASSTIIITGLFFIGCLRICVGKIGYPRQIPVHVPQIQPAKPIVAEAVPCHQKPNVSYQDNNVYHSLA